MNATIYAALDGQDRLVSDDPRLADLHCRLGGVADGAIHLPQVTALARAARRLGRMLTRPVTLSSPNTDIVVWVRAQPEAGIVRLTLFDWAEEPIETSMDKRQSMDEVEREGAGSEPENVVEPLPEPVAKTEAEHVSEPSAEPVAKAETPVPAWFETALTVGWRWRIDAGFRLLDVVGRAPLPSYGTALTRWLSLAVDEDGVMPLLIGVAARSAFSDQPARLVNEPDAPLMLAGEPIMVDGRFAGYRGKLMPVVADTPEPIVTQPETEPEPEPTPQLANATAPAAGVSLDNALRRPLGRIIANADTISGQLEGPLRRDYATYAADIAVAGRHLMALVDDLADLRAIERPNFVVAHEQVDLADVARRAGGLLGVKAADRKIRLDLPAKDDPLPANAEFRRVLQILVNLIGNAVRYSPEGSQVWVRGEVMGDRVTITVADQGRGIAPDDQVRIFEKFERLGRRDSGGSGLGLYISRRLARAMGGELSIESALGQGARFTLDLPVWKPGA